MNVSGGQALAARVDEKYQHVWKGLQPEQSAALAWYFLPHRSRKATLSPTRPRVIKWYCPFAHQQVFPSGHRYCINVYTGCQHHCVYCYAAGYEPEKANQKTYFERGLLKDLGDLDQFAVPPAPVHLSNSTDPLQPLETATGHTRFAVQEIRRRRHRFTTVTVLTKNPLLASEPPYIGLLQQLIELPATHPRAQEFSRRALPGLRVEVSLAFWRDDVRSVFDPGAPSVNDRMRGIRRLRDAGIPVVLRVDPLLPRSPLRGRSLADFGLPEAQPLEDLERLAEFAAEVGAMHIAYSAAKIVRPRFRKMSPVMQDMKRAYEYLAAPNRLKFQGGCWRLPSEIAHDCVTQPFAALCRAHGVDSKFCMRNLIETP